MITTIRPMLASLIGGWELILILAALLMIPVMAIVVGSLVFFIVRRSSGQKPANPEFRAGSAQPAHQNSPSQNPPQLASRKRALWILPLLVAVVAGATFFIVHSEVQKNQDIGRLTPAEFFQVLYSNRIVKATVFRDRQSPLVEVRGTYKRQDSAETVVPFVSPKMPISDQALDRLTSLPNVAIVENHGARPFITFVPLALILIFLMAIVCFIVGLLFITKRFAPRAPPIQPIAPVQAAPRNCPKCGAPLRADAPEGLCPACLLQHGIATEGGAPPGTAFTPPPLLELAKLFPQLE